MATLDVEKTSKEGVSLQILGFHDENEEEEVEESNKGDEGEEMGELEEEKGIEEDEESESEEAIDPMVMCVPCRPTQAEVDKHNITQLSLRTCCPACDTGIIQSAPHKTTTQEASEHTSLQIDQ